MIMQVKKNCIEAIERALTNINHIKMQWSSSFPKPAQQKLHSVQNDLELLKDNFTLVISKVLRLESRCNEKESMAVKVQHKYRLKFDNNCLRSEIHSLQNSKGLNGKFRKVINQIERLVSNNGENLQNNVRRLIAPLQKDFQQGNSNGGDQLREGKDAQMENDQLGSNTRVRSISQFSLQHPPIKQEVPLKQQNLIINSCELKVQKDQRTKKKPQLTKQSLELHETASTEKKKRGELAKLVEQQSRLARINERYLSTDIY